MKLMYKRMLIGLAVVAYVAANYFGGAYIFNQGQQSGATNYHNTCYYVGGFMIDESTGLVVQCRGLAKISPEELEMQKKQREELDKKRNV